MVVRRVMSNQLSVSFGRRLATARHEMRMADTRVLREPSMTSLALTRGFATCTPTRRHAAGRPVHDE